jgi:hypothetical protein
MSKKQKTTSKKPTKATTKAAGKAPAKTDPDLVPLSQMDKEKKAAKTEKKLSLLDAAAQVLKAKGEPMTCGAMVEAVMAKKLWTTDAPTPAATLYSAILREMKKGKESRFKKTDRGHFALANS